MSPEAFKPFLKEPKPMRIDLADGSKISVRHGGYLGMQPGGPVFLVWTAQSFKLYELASVTSVSVISRKRKKGSEL